MVSRGTPGRSKSGTRSEYSLRRGKGRGGGSVAVRMSSASKSRGRWLVTRLIVARGRGMGRQAQRAGIVVPSLVPRDRT